MDELLILEVLLRLLSLLVSCVGCYMLYEVLLRCKDLIQALCKVQWLFQSLHFVTIMVFFHQKNNYGVFSIKKTIGLLHNELVRPCNLWSFPHHITSNSFVCIKWVPVPVVPQTERFLFRRVCPKNYHMFHCIARYELYFSVSKNEIKMCCLPE
jgi:hypothetical protein